MVVFSTLLTVHLRVSRPRRGTSAAMSEPMKDDDEKEKQTGDVLALVYGSDGEDNQNKPLANDAQHNADGMLYF
jgi:hypothetical protein